MMTGPSCARRWARASTAQRGLVCAIAAATPPRWPRRRAYAAIAMLSALAWFALGLVAGAIL